MPQYSYDGETGYNPFYEVITKDLPFTFCHDEKRIFALRTDFLMTTGRKNTDKKKQYPGSFHQKITPEEQSFIDENNRYGHPSIAAPYKTPDYEYDGSVYWAGWVRFKDKDSFSSIECLPFSGRFNRLKKYLTIMQENLLHFYMAAQWMEASTVDAVSFIYPNLYETKYLIAFLSGIDVCNISQTEGRTLTITREMIEGLSFILTKAKSLKPFLEDPQLTLNFSAHNRFKIIKRKDIR